MSQEWLKLRTYFSYVPRFNILEKSSGSESFFYLLEINSQISALLSQIKFDMTRKSVTVMRPLKDYNLLLKVQVYSQGVNILKI